MAMCYLCDLCRHHEYIASITRLKCHGESGAIIAIKTIDYGRDDPLEVCQYFEPKEGGNYADAEQFAKSLMESAMELWVRMVELRGEGENE